MDIEGKAAIVTGAGSGIGQAVVEELVRRKVQVLGMVDLSPEVEAAAQRIAAADPGVKVMPFVGDVSDEAFRSKVFADIAAENGPARILVPAAGITRDRLSVKLDKETGKCGLYPWQEFELVTKINLLSPIYWAMQMVACIAEDRFARGLKRWNPEEGVQGAVVFIGSVSSQGNKGQIAYAATKAGLEGAAATLTKEAIFFGVRCGVIHPGFTNTPMVQALGEKFIEEHILPQTQLRRLIRPSEIADAICFMIGNSAVSGELWADAGWHPAA